MTFYRLKITYHYANPEDCFTVVNRIEMFLTSSNLCYARFYMDLDVVTVTLIQTLLKQESLQDCSR